VGMIFQSFNLISTMSAADNVALAMMFADVPRARRDERAQELLASMGLGDRRAHRPKELSGGEQQRVAIARALANDPQLLLADEPTGALDSETGAQIVALLRRLRDERGTTLLMVTNDDAVAAAAARGRRLRAGRLAPRSG